MKTSSSISQCVLLRSLTWPSFSAGMTSIFMINYEPKLDWTEPNAPMTTALHVFLFIDFTSRIYPDRSDYSPAEIPCLDCITFAGDMSFVETVISRSVIYVHA